MDRHYYRVPLRILPSLFLDGLLGRKRSFRQLARDCIQHLDPPLVILGRENIPASIPAVVTVNHYHRPGFGAEWLAMAVSSVTPLEIHWIITGELTFPGKSYGFMGRPLSRLILDRGARIFGFTTMPPMPPREQDVLARAGSVRAVFKYVRHSAIPVIGLAPEGADNPGRSLADPPVGFGRFALLLADLGLQFIPVGVYENQGSLCLHFGNAFKITHDNLQDHDQTDKLIARKIMERIACLIPNPRSVNLLPDHPN